MFTHDGEELRDYKIANIGDPLKQVFHSDTIAQPEWLEYARKLREQYEDQGMAANRGQKVQSATTMDSKTHWKYLMSVFKRVAEDQHAKPDPQIRAELEDLKSNVADAKARYEQVAATSNTVFTSNPEPAELLAVLKGRVAELKALREQSEQPAPQQLEQEQQPTALLGFKGRRGSVSALKNQYEQRVFDRQAEAQPLPAQEEPSSQSANQAGEAPAASAEEGLAPSRTHRRP